MIFGKLSAALMVGAIAVGSIIGAPGISKASPTGIKPASLTKYKYLCTFAASNGTGSICAYAAGANPIRMISKVSSTTNWFYPEQGDSANNIKQANTTDCMELNTSDYTVKEAGCNGNDEEVWVAKYNSSTGRTEFYSAWGVANQNRDLCLSYDKDDAILKADPCTPGGGTSYWYQQFAAS